MATHNNMNKTQEHNIKRKKSCRILAQYDSIYIRL